MADKAHTAGSEMGDAAAVRAASATKKAEKVRGIGLVAIVTVLLLSAMGYLAVCAVNPDLAPAKKLLLDNRNTVEFPQCTLQTLASGEFQSGFEQAASDHVPYRDNLLQANAAVQRLGVRTANLPFGYSAIPTYYGSNYAEATDAGIVQEMPALQSKKMEAAFAANAEALNKLAEKIEGTLVYYRPARLSCSSISPVSKLMNNIADEDYVQDVFLDKLDDRWQLASNEYSSLKDYKEDFFRTDHHWKIGGAVKGYEAIMDALGKEPISLSEPKSVGWPAWYGSASRIGIDFTVKGEKVQDVEYERSELKVTVDGEEKNEAVLDRGYRAKGAKSYTPKKAYENYYGTWFHGDYGTLVLENPSCENGETLLVIGDSYTNCMDRFFAESYARVVVVDPRYFEGSLSSLIDEEKPTDLVCLLSDYMVRSTEDNVTSMLSS